MTEQTSVFNGWVQHRKNHATTQSTLISELLALGNVQMQLLEQLKMYQSTDNTARLSKDRYDEIRERYSEVRGRIERISERTDQNRAVTNENNRLTDRNTGGIDGIKQITGQVREAIKAKEQELERAKVPTRSRSPSMGR